MPILQDRILAVLEAAEFYQDLSRVLMTDLRAAFRAQTDNKPAPVVAALALEALYSAEPMLVHAEQHIAIVAREREHYKQTHKHNVYMREYQQRRRAPQQSASKPITLKPTVTAAILSDAAIAARIERGEISTNGKRYQPLDSEALATVAKLLAESTPKDASETTPAEPKDVLEI